MDSVDQVIRKRKQVRSKSRARKDLKAKQIEAENVKPSDPNSLGEAFKARGWKVKKLGTDWRFSNGATFKETEKLYRHQINPVLDYFAEYCKDRRPNDVTLNSASILKQLGLSNG